MNFLLLAFAFMLRIVDVFLELNIFNSLPDIVLNLHINIPFNLIRSIMQHVSVMIYS